MLVRTVRQNARIVSYRPIVAFQGSEDKQERLGGKRYLCSVVMDVSIPSTENYQIWFMCVEVIPS